MGVVAKPGTEVRLRVFEMFSKRITKEDSIIRQNAMLVLIQLSDVKNGTASEFRFGSCSVLGVSLIVAKHPDSINLSPKSRETGKNAARFALSGWLT